MSFAYRMSKFQDFVSYIIFNSPAKIDTFSYCTFAGCLLSCKYCEIFNIHMAFSYRTKISNFNIWHRCISFHSKLRKMPDSITQAFFTVNKIFFVKYTSLYLKKSTFKKTGVFFPIFPFFSEERGTPKILII